MSGTQSRAERIHNGPTDGQGDNSTLDQLWRDYQAGNGDALGTLFTRLNSHVERQIQFGFNFSEDTAQELAQRTWLRVMEIKDRCQLSEGRNFLGWLIRVARIQCVKFFGEHKRTNQRAGRLRHRELQQGYGLGTLTAEQELEYHDLCWKFSRNNFVELADDERIDDKAIDGSPLALDALCEAEQMERLTAAVGALPDDLRAAVRLVYFVGLSQVAAGNALGMGKGALQLQIRKAEAIVANALEGKVPCPEELLTKRKLSAARPAKRTRNTYSDEFKANAVALAKQTNCCQAAKKLGIDRETVRGFMEQAKLPAKQAPADLLERIMERIRSNGGLITLRQLYHSFNCLRKSAPAKAALDELASQGRGQWVRISRKVYFKLSENSQSAAA